MTEEVKIQEAAKPAEEEQTNCLACNKPIKRLRRYYRNGKYYCTKKCWAKFIETKKSEKKEKGK
jgi:hypothetical protein